MTERFLTINEVAELLGVHHGTIRRMIARGTLRAVRVGRLWRVPQAALIALEQAAQSERKPLLPTEGAAAQSNGSRAVAQS
jgi:excisionase family DNA binding protein